MISIYRYTGLSTLALAGYLSDRQRRGKRDSHQRRGMAREGAMDTDEMIALRYRHRPEETLAVHRT
ncbi:MAG: hypothetical protein ACFCVA_00325 [Gammaproteobacteria bacterium]